MTKKFTLRAGYEAQDKPCEVCGGKPKAKGLCNSHYASFRRRIRVAEDKAAKQLTPDELWEFAQKELNLA